MSAEKAQKSINIGRSHDMLVKLKKDIKVSDECWYRPYIGKDMTFDVKPDGSVINWKDYVTPYELRQGKICGLQINPAHYESPEYELVSAKGSHLIFKAGGNPKPKHIFVVPEVNANTETTYVLSKINGKPMREVLLTLSYYGFDIYTKAGEEI